MSKEASESGGKNSRVYGFPNRSGQDRYTQNIIDHASNLFPVPDHQFPRFVASAGDDLNAEEREISRLYHENQDVDSHLDDFGRLVFVSQRRLLGSANYPT